VVHKQARQIKETGEPAHDEEDVKGFDPEHICYESSVEGEESSLAAARPASTVGKMSL
jgi:hypothetical protein